MNLKMHQTITSVVFAAMLVPFVVSQAKADVSDALSRKRAHDDKQVDDHRVSRRGRGQDDRHVDDHRLARRGRGQDDTQPDDRGTDAGRVDDHGSDSSGSTSSTPSNPGLSSDDSSSLEASVRRKTKSKSSVIQKDEFSAKVDIPVPTASLNINSESDAVNAIVLLQLSRNNVEYAECLLQLDDFEVEHGVTKAEYKVDIRSQLKKGNLVTTVKKGSCDTNFATAGAENLVPSLQSGDAAQISVNGTVLSTPVSIRLK